MKQQPIYKWAILGVCQSFSLGLMAQQMVDTCPNHNVYHQVVNKERSLVADYKPSNLIIPNVWVLQSGNIEKNHMEKTAALHLEELFKGAAEENINLVAISGYRSYNRQSALYNQYIRQYGKKYTDTVSAQPGKSEHQTGLAMDVSAKSVGYSLSTQFGKTKEGIWLAQNAHNYGFIIRYPKGKEKITGYSYEPWHIRYVGQELAQSIYTQGLTLEEVENCCLLEEEKKSEQKETTNEQNQLKVGSKEEVTREEQMETEKVSIGAVLNNSGLKPEGTGLIERHNRLGLVWRSVRNFIGALFQEKK